VEIKRRLVTVRTIAALDPIPGADAIEVATIEGWKVVVKKGDFTVGQPCLYFEIDSFLPETDLRYEFLMKAGVREFEGVRGHRLRTIKLRGQVSQGLVLPIAKESAGGDIISIFPEVLAVMTAQHLDCTAARHLDFASILGIKKYEAPIPACLAGQAKGFFPTFIKKTDQERCQNLITEIFGDLDALYEVTVKLDGTSATFFHYYDEVGACSRNLELKINEENKDNTIVKMFVKSGLAAALASGKLGNVAVQGEIMGPGIQGNREQLKDHKFFIFDVQYLDHSGSGYLTAEERGSFYRALLDNGVNPDMVGHVPIDSARTTLRELNISNVQELLAYAEGPSLKHPVREGLVFKRIDGKFSFKAISNAFLVKEKE
jgi:RNA ligase (TIGR02306 family)